MAARLVLVALALVAASIPLPSAAQSLPPARFSLDPDVGSFMLKPEGPGATVSFAWEYEPGMAADPVLFAAVREATIKWTTACVHPALAITGPSTETIDLWPGSPTAAPPNEVTGTTSFTVTASRDAPGLHLLECKFSGLVESAQPQAIPDSSEASVSMAFTVEYAGRAEARAPQTVAEAGPQKVAAFDIEVANHFNAQTTFVAELADAPPEGWRVIVPPPLTLDAVQLGGGRVQDTMTVVVQTPYQEGMNVGELPFSVRLRPSASLDASLQAEPVTLSFVAKVRGLYCSDIEKPVPECEEAIDAIVDACERGEPPEGFQEEACTPILQARSRSSPAPGAAILVALGAVALAVRRRRHVP